MDLRVCLDSSICDTETHGLLYVAPGKTDFALVFDASGSMDTEDVAGEGKRVDQAKRAGTVLADLLRDGDRIAVTDFSAFDDPAGCGLPYGSGNCALDIRTRLARTNVTVPGTITAAKNAIDLISPREWTPIGAALLDAKNKLTAAPVGDNPKHIILLSDGEENVNPLYSAARAELIASGVVIDTIAFSYEAPAALMGQIAAETGGTMRYVPTTGGTAAQGTMTGLSAAEMEEVTRRGLPAGAIEGIMTALAPGHLALADVYDYYETKGQGASRIFHDNYTMVANNTWQVKEQFVDGFVTTLRLVVSGKQYDGDVVGPGCVGGYHRQVEIIPADAADPQRGWIPVSPPVPSPTPPAAWSIRNSAFDDVVIVPNPAPGVWKIRTRYNYVICASGAPDAEATSPAGSVQLLESDFMMNGSVESDIRVQGRFLPPIVNNKGLPGDHVPIVATVVSKVGTVPGLLVLAGIEKPNGAGVLVLWDDGAHMDGAAGDGIYGNSYNLTDVGGAYNVRIVAFGYDPVAAQWATREWLGSFWIRPVSQDDGDKDGMPDTWERACGLNTSASDQEGDPDHDGLVNILEFHYGTTPCDPDTDDGGENDSEVLRGRNPLYAPDDLVRRLSHFNIRALNGMIRIDWSRPLSYTSMMVTVAPSGCTPGGSQDMGRTGTFTLTQLPNGCPHSLTFRGMNGTAETEAAGPFEATPKSDPDAPTGAVVINGGAYATVSPNVVLGISATDTPPDGMVTPANFGAGGGPLALAFNTVSGGVEMRISNDAAFAGAVWEPLAFTKPWVLSPPPGGTARVFVQFRDAAQNESLAYWDDIAMPRYYLPIVSKQ